MNRLGQERCADCGAALNWIELTYGRLNRPICGRCLAERLDREAYSDDPPEWTVDEILEREG